MSVAVNVIKSNLNREAMSEHNCLIKSLLFFI